MYAPYFSRAAASAASIASPIISPDDHTKRFPAFRPAGHTTNAYASAMTRHAEQFGLGWSIAPWTATMTGRFDVAPSGGATYATPPFGSSRLCNHSPRSGGRPASADAALLATAAGSASARDGAA